MSEHTFRRNHILNLLNSYEEQHLPLDLFISLYFRKHKALGSKDRAFVADTIYGMVRWKGLLDHLCTSAVNWDRRLGIYEKINPVDYLAYDDIPIDVRLSFPKPLFDLIINSHGNEKGAELCRISNFPAPTTVRINPLKTTREEMLKKWRNSYSVYPCTSSEFGIIFPKKINFFSLPEFKEGLFEVQDEGSQLLAALVKASPGQQVLDYCAGSGGKTLAFAYQLAGKGQIYLHDIRSHALLESKKRLKRAGIQNAQLVQAEDPKFKKLKKKMDWVLVDAPCSGTGTLRRNPDMKWKFSPDYFLKQLGQQRLIFEKALSFMHPEGKIVYGTCSLLKEENQEQLDHFMKTYNLQVEGSILQTLPTEGGMDGFFGVVLKHN